MRKKKNVELARVGGCQGWSHVAEHVFGMCKAGLNTQDQKVKEGKEPLFAAWMARPANLYRRQVGAYLYTEQHTQYRHQNNLN